MKKQMVLLALSILILILSTYGCKKQEEQKKEITIQRIMPPQASFYAMKRMTKSVDWSKVVDTTKLKANDATEGFQLGVVFANWTLASIIKAEDKVETLTTNWVELTKDFEIEDDAVLLRAKDKIDDLKQYVDGGDNASYQKLTREIKGIYKEFKDYYEREGNDEFVYQATLSVWLEFLYIGVKGVLEEYSPEATELFNRHQEVDYFRDILKGKPGFKNEVKFLTYLRPQVTLVTGERLTKEQVEYIKKMIEKFRNERI